MTITTTKLTQAAGISAAAAGAIFVGVQIKHPAWTVQAFTDGINWQLRSIAKLVMSGLAIAGLTGMYLHQRRRMGKLGLVGYVTFVIGYLFMAGVEAIAAFVLPGEAHSRPGYVNDVLRAAAGLKTAGDIGSRRTGQLRPWPPGDPARRRPPSERPGARARVRVGTCCGDQRPRGARVALPQPPLARDHGARGRPGRTCQSARRCAPAA
jgi:hypothetical protein